MRGLGGAAARPRPFSLYQMLQPAHQRPVYQLRIIRCSTVIAFGVQRVKRTGGIRVIKSMLFQSARTEVISVCGLFSVCHGPCPIPICDGLKISHSIGVGLKISCRTLKLTLWVRLFNQSIFNNNKGPSGHLHCYVVWQCSNNQTQNRTYTYIQIKTLTRSLIYIGILEGYLSSLL